MLFVHQPSSGPLRHLATAAIAGAPSKIPRKDRGAGALVVQLVEMLTSGKASFLWRKVKLDYDRVVIGEASMRDLKKLLMAIGEMPEYLVPYGPLPAASCESQNLWVHFLRKSSGRPLLIWLIALSNLVDGASSGPSASGSRGNRAGRFCRQS